MTDRQADTQNKAIKYREDLQTDKETRPTENGPDEQSGHTSYLLFIASIFKLPSYAVQSSLDLVLAQKAQTNRLTEQPLSANKRGKKDRQSTDNGQTDRKATKEPVVRQ